MSQQRSYLKLQKLKQLTALLLFFSPLVNLYYSYSQYAREIGFFSWLSRLEFSSVAMLLLLSVAGFSLLLSKTWARYFALSVLSVVSVYNIYLFNALNEGSMAELILLCLSNLTVGAIIFTERRLELRFPQLNLPNLRVTLPSPRALLAKAMLPFFSKANNGPLRAVPDLIHAGLMDRRRPNAPLFIAPDQKAPAKLQGVFVHKRVYFKNIDRRGVIYFVSNQSFWIRWTTPPSGPIVPLLINIQFGVFFTLKCRRKQIVDDKEEFEFVSMNDEQNQKLHKFLDEARQKRPA